MTTNEKLSLLRVHMKEAGVQAYLIPSSDPHISEYLPDHWRARAWLSGFDGSAGTLVVTETESGLWTDGRYFIQAQRQMEGSEIVLYRMGEKGVPTVQEFLLSRLKAGETLGLDGMVTATSIVLDMEAQFVEREIGIRAVDLIAPIWVPPSPKALSICWRRNTPAFPPPRRSPRSAPVSGRTAPAPWWSPGWTAWPGSSTCGPLTWRTIPPLWPMPS